MAQHASPKLAGHELRGPGPLDEVLDATGDDVVRHPGEAVVADVVDHSHGRPPTPLPRATGAPRPALGADLADRRGQRALRADLASVGDEVADALQRTPVETAAGDLVDEGQEEQRREDHDRDEPVRADVAVGDRVRVHEDDLDVEHDEQHRHDVEADREALRRLAAGDDAALVRRVLGRRRPLRRQQVRHHRLIAPNTTARSSRHDDRQVLAHGSTCASTSRAGAHHTIIPQGPVRRCGSRRACVHDGAAASTG